MKIITPVINHFEIEPALQYADEIIICPKDYSRFGKLSLQEAFALAKKVKEKKKTILLQWDILMNEDQLERLKVILKMPEFHLFDAIRIRDWGLLNLIKDKKIHLICENNHHNSQSVCMWQECFPKTLDRVVLSSQLSYKQLKHYQNISINRELLILGAIILYHSPRKLLNTTDILKASNLERTQRDMLILENHSGSYIFYDRYLFLLHFIKEIKELGIDSLRVEDVTMLAQTKELINNFTKSKALQLKEEYPKKTFAGFFIHNRTDGVFDKLHKGRMRPEDNCVGEVVEAIKPKRLGILIKKEEHISFEDKLLFKTPDGKRKEIKVSSLYDSSGNSCQKISGDKIAFVKYISGITARSTVYRLC